MHRTRGYCSMISTRRAWSISCPAHNFRAQVDNICTRIAGYDHNVNTRIKRLIYSFVLSTCLLGFCPRKCFGSSGNALIAITHTKGHARGVLLKRKSGGHNKKRIYDKSEIRTHAPFETTILVEPERSALDRSAILPFPVDRSSPRASFGSPSASSFPWQFLHSLLRGDSILGLVG